RVRLSPTCGHPSGHHLPPLRAMSGHGVPSKRKPSQLGSGGRNLPAPGEARSANPDKANDVASLYEGSDLCRFRHISGVAEIAYRVDMLSLPVQQNEIARTTR